MASSTALERTALPRNRSHEQRKRGRHSHAPAVINNAASARLTPGSPRAMFIAKRQRAVNACSMDRSALRHSAAGV
eukprot:365725-Chlamydomonas_euryale.AAC.2